VGGTYGRPLIKALATMPTGSPITQDRIGGQGNFGTSACAWLIEAPELDGQQ
jgi:hypothetical protein